MSALILSHTMFGVLALAAGAFVFLRRKGDVLHRRVGWVYSVALAVLCLESYWIKDSTPFFQGFGMFHIMATVSLVTLIGGVIPAWRRKPENWLGWHYQMMAWSYIGLVMATGSHVFRPVFLFFLRDLGLPGTACWIATAVLLWGLPPTLGVALLNKREAQWNALAVHTDGPKD